MIRWEYYILRSDWFSGGGLMLQSPETRKLVPLETELTRLGDLGWEAVNIQHAPMAPSGGRLVILLKRPKEG